MLEPLIHKIEKFSSEERKLLLYKLKSLWNVGMAEDKHGKARRLVAYIKPHSSINVLDLHEYLKMKLPEYMVPASLELVDEFPLLANGKIDKIALTERSKGVFAEKKVSPVITDTEKQLVEIWEEILDFSPVHVTDNFFEIGGDSIISIKMFWMIEKKLKVKLPPTTLFKNPTIASIAEKIKTFTVVKENVWKYLVPFRATGNKDPLFCMHGGEGHVLFYKTLPGYLHKERPVYLVQPKGINGIEPMHDSIEQMSKDYIAEIMQVEEEGPYHLLFYCYSPLVVEMARQFRNMNRTANIIVVDSSPKNLESRARLTRKERFIHYFRKFRKYPLRTLKASLQHRYRRHLEPFYIRLSKDLVAQKLQHIRKQLQKVRYQYRWEKFDTRITLILAKNEHPEIMKRDLDLWNYWCIPGVDVLPNPGNHFNLFEKPHVEALGKNIEKVCSRYD